MNVFSTTRWSSALNRCLLAFIGAAAPLLAQAQLLPVIVGAEGLPPGLFVMLSASRAVCPDGLTFVSVGRLPATESQRVVYDSVPQASGPPILRARTITRYTAQFNIAPEASPCNLVNGNLLFSAEVAGMGAAPTLVFRRAAVGSANFSTASLNLVFTLRAMSLQPHVGNFTFIPPWQRALINAITVQHKNPFGAASVVSPTLEIRRIPTLVGQPEPLVARVFIRPNGTECVQTASQLRCIGDAPGTTVTLAGVTIHSSSRHPNFIDIESTDFVMTLTNEFVPGTYRLRAFADDLDPIEYLVDGALQPLNLLPWQAFNGTVIVQ